MEKTATDMYNEALTQRVNPWAYMSNQSWWAQPMSTPETPTPTATNLAVDTQPQTPTPDQQYADISNKRIQAWEQYSNAIQNYSKWDIIDKMRLKTGWVADLDKAIWDLQTQYNTSRPQLMQKYASVIDPVKREALISAEQQSIWNQLNSLNSVRNQRLWNIKDITDAEIEDSKNKLLWLEAQYKLYTDVMWDMEKARKTKTDMEKEFQSLQKLEMENKVYAEQYGLTKNELTGWYDQTWIVKPNKKLSDYIEWSVWDIVTAFKEWATIDDLVTNIQQIWYSEAKKEDIVSIIWKLTAWNPEVKNAILKDYVTPQNEQAPWFSSNTPANYSEFDDYMRSVIPVLYPNFSWNKKEYIKIVKEIMETQWNIDEEYLKWFTEYINSL